MTSVVSQGLSTLLVRGLSKASTCGNYPPRIRNASYRSHLMPLDCEKPSLSIRCSDEGDSSARPHCITSATVEQSAGPQSLSHPYICMNKFDNLLMHHHTWCFVVNAPLSMHVHAPL